MKYIWIRVVQFNYCCHKIHIYMDTNTRTGIKGSQLWHRQNCIVIGRWWLTSLLDLLCSTELKAELFIFQLIFISLLKWVQEKWFTFVGRTIFLIRKESEWFSIMIPLRCIHFMTVAPKEYQKWAQFEINKCRYNKFEKLFHWKVQTKHTNHPGD